MPGQLNPDKNLYSVAPVGAITIIGHSAGLKMGLTRDRALNLIAWLTIATGATQAEIQGEMDDARSGAPSGSVGANAPQVIQQARPSMSNSVAGAPLRGKDIDPELAAQIASQLDALKKTKEFVGEVDAEEGAAINAALPSNEVANG